MSQENPSTFDEIVEVVPYVVPWIQVFLFLANQFTQTPGTETAFPDVSHLLFLTALVAMIEAHRRELKPNHDLEKFIINLVFWSLNNIELFKTWIAQ